MTPSYNLATQIKRIQSDRTIINPEKAIYDLIVSSLSTRNIYLEELIQALREDHNLISSTVAMKLWENAILECEDFMKAGVTKDVMNHMQCRNFWTRYTHSESLSKVSKSPCTEVYFWGLPSSGKDMVIAATLSEANERYSLEKDHTCQGYGNMERLVSHFKNGCISTLPCDQYWESAEMGFDLCSTENKIPVKIPVTFFNLSPSLIPLMYKKEAGEHLSGPDIDRLKTLTDVMIDNRTQNCKLHFFVIEYGAEDRQDIGLPQQVYLQAAIQYIQRTGIFKKDTDGVYIIISKVDNANVHGRELKEKLKEYVLANYNAFYNSLRKICRDNEINGGEVGCIPFSLGETWFRDICIYDNRASSRLLDLIVEHCHYRIYTSMFQRIINKFRRTRYYIIKKLLQV